ncbi:MAG: hypothetical protein UU73_C0001G0349 [Candidatus Daviesbacteria bacterium GW2011_GWA1_41_61]|uniref:SpoVT-AbrB domain-containing protein n=1 Tax=Candidatus Daviesbacteria bacterium GW2011_GWA2_40_9 TaxID=1618424 RepID=A0A0G0U066_9BACT|nr:MAG: hypothetical protein UU26_C0016G0018 [Candidatus Daviesbacteria bacterium GW2011_GWC1_40_9]KKR82473.1 MAG: hypothetical protein UU29_C0012G0011 [Candidatus Daviesbacteria bacterium GW2011_GWA2_40_9]KKR93168.1 MAG: hypothetical protein UU44_C0004G0350 [Candidatus Daviesbacteria bacterium GW2011_GWB1_41_15]KKS15712.1 MAG: hypothetical protein UU73_C0001G0349 [Candidatus Daviesbacteria bacterium GW2011_GWA1_41_61]
MQTYSPNNRGKEEISTISSKGQVTIPVKVRKHLGIKSNDKIAFVIESSGEVKVTPAKYPDIQSLKGVAGSLTKPLSWEKVKQIAQADRLSKKYGR